MRFWLPIAFVAASLAAYPSYEANGQNAQKPAAIEPAQPAPLPTKEDPIIRAVLQQLKPTTRANDNAASSERAALLTYYAKYIDEPIWLTTDHKLNERAKATMRAIENADAWGLSANDFRLPLSVADLKTVNSTSAPTTPDALARAEIALSLAALKYARHARGGRIPDPTVQLSSYLDRKPQLVPTGTVMDALRQRHDPGKYLEGLHPKHAQFEKLRKALLELRNGATRPQKPEDTKLPPTGPVLGLGRTHQDVALLRKRLSVPAPTTTQDAPSSNDDHQAVPKNPLHVFDQTVKDAVKAYQKEHGLYQDGLVGRATRRALNSAGSGAITQEVLIANMEAWRWMPEDLGATYVTVNIPEYKVRVVSNANVIHEELAIVGKTNNQTPVFSDAMESVVLHPSWGVPNSIKVKEIWPSLARGGPVLQRQGLRIKRNGRVINPNTIDWAYADIRNYDVYQPPGSRNVLGIVKFLFPNKHQVYMHDTPTKNLFKQNVRTYSHGCMRLQNPVRLAEIVLEQDKNWTPKQVNDLLRTGPQQNKILLDTKIPVHVTYFTVVVDDDGTVRRLRDVYGHEKRIKLAVAGKFDQIAVGKDHLKPVRYSRRNIQPQSFSEIFQSVFGGF